MKGSIACMLAAVEQLDSSPLRQPIYITCTSDEEVGFLGAKHWVAQSSLYREMVDGNARGIIGEPTRLQVVHAHKGGIALKATSQGRAAHSSTREGINANLAMIPFLVEMKAIHDETEADPAWHNHEFDPPTISWNIGINDFTKAINITPGQSVCTVYFRPMPGTQTQGLIQRVQRAAERQGLELNLLYFNEPMYVEPTAPLIQEVLQLTGHQEPQTVSYGTDGGVLQEMKQLVVLGPGDVAQAHTVDEWIALEQLESGTALYKKLIQHWCC